MAMVRARRSTAMRSNLELLPLAPDVIFTGVLLWWLEPESLDSWFIGPDEGAALRSLGSGRFDRFETLLAPTLPAPSRPRSLVRPSSRRSVTVRPRPTFRGQAAHPQPAVVRWGFFAGDICTSSWCLLGGILAVSRWRGSVPPSRRTGIFSRTPFACAHLTWRSDAMQCPRHGSVT